MNILFVSAEATPFAKAGGLGDVIGALPLELNKCKVEARVIMPLYRSIKEKYFSKMKKIVEFQTNVSWRRKYCGLYSLKHKNTIFYFIDNEEYFFRDNYYGFFDDGERFSFFSNAVLDALPLLENFNPDILHCNEWQTALVPIYMRGIYSRYDNYKKIKTIFSIHNIEYQGQYGMETAKDVFGIPENMYDIVEYRGCINLMKGAIESCDKLITVSPSYAEEIKHGYFAKGLEEIIRKNENKLVGILNGIDSDLFNPATDKYLYENYSYENYSHKRLNKIELRNELGLVDCGDAPIIGMVTRFVEHKGIDLVMYILDKIMEENVQMVVLGSGDKQYEDFFREAMNRYPGRFHSNICFSIELASKIYGGCDMFLMPSLREPCGLAQMIAAKYGTIPIVRSVGGLKDSIKPYNLEDKSGNGITFGQINADDMMGAIKRGIYLYWNKEEWNHIVKNAFLSDFSWNKSTKEYIEIYRELLGEN